MRKIRYKPSEIEEAITMTLRDAEKWSEGHDESYLVGWWVAMARLEANLKGMRKSTDDRRDAEAD